MIQNHEDFLAALEDVSAYLEHPPAPGTVEAGVFAALLRDIERYNPTIAAAADTLAPGRAQTEAQSLASRAAALLNVWEERERHNRFSTFPEDGEGIGPTTGV